MDDDLDDLLNEVESKFCATKLDSARTAKKLAPVTDSVTATSKVNSTTTGPEKGPAKRAKDSDLNSMIDDIFDDSMPEADATPVRTPQPRSAVNSSSASSGTTSSGTARCFPVSIGGTASERGISTAVHQRTCDTLRCTDCDFRVEMFDNLCWRPDTDYLFLRNNIPDYDKLKVNLVKRTGWRAYACQCKSKSVEDRIELQQTNLKWVCGKH